MALSTDGGRSFPLYTAAIAAGATADTVVAGRAGMLGTVLLTSANGAAAVSIFDNASGHTGTIIGYIPASAVIGSMYVFNMPASNGIVVLGAATNPAMTISYR